MVRWNDLFEQGKECSVNSFARWGGWNQDCSKRSMSNTRKRREIAGSRLALVRREGGYDPG
jgi:hypothetical protein